jgi:hypothetical protein
VATQGSCTLAGAVRHIRQAEAHVQVAGGVEARGRQPLPLLTSTTCPCLRPATHTYGVHGDLHTMGICRGLNNQVGTVCSQWWSQSSRGRQCALPSCTCNSPAARSLTVHCQVYQLPTIGYATGACACLSGRVHVWSHIYRTLVCTNDQCLIPVVVHIQYAHVYMEVCVTLTIRRTTSSSMFMTPLSLHHTSYSTYRHGTSYIRSTTCKVGEHAQWVGS